MNHVILTGRLTKDPEIRYTDSKKAVASFTLAVDDGKGRDGERKAQFIPVVAWEKTAELIDQYFKKGDPLTVIGRITVRNYTTKDGDRRYVTEVVASGIEFPLTANPRPRDVRETEGVPAPVNAFSEYEDDDGELPF